MSVLDHIRDGWDAAAQQDAMANILTTGLSWDPDAFFQNGTSEIGHCLAHLDEHGLRGRRRKRALDFGCGVGRLTQALANHYQRVVGVDIAPSMIVQAEALNRYPGRVTYWATDELIGADYDLVYTNLVLQHMPQPLAHAYIRDFIRALHPDGLAVFGIPEGPDYQHPQDHLSMWATSSEKVEQVVTHAGGQIVDIDVVPGGGDPWIPYRYAVRRRP